MDFWTLLTHVRGRKDCLAGWARVFGQDFNAVRPMLRPCPGEYCAAYPDPQTGGLLNLSRFGDRWAAYRDPEADDDGPDIELTEADVLLYQLDGDGLRERLRTALGVVGPSSALDSDLECLGTCAQGPRRRRVYLCHARNEGEAITGAQEVITRAGAEGCALLPNLSETVDRMLARAGVSGVHLAGSLALTTESAQGGCGITCRHLSNDRADKGGEHDTDGMSGDVILRIGRLGYRIGFQDVWLEDAHFDLRERTKARLCIQYLVEMRAFDAASARHLREEIDPYVRQRGDFPPSVDIKIDHYFNDPHDPKKALPGLRKKLIVAAGRNGRYFLKTN